MRRVVVLAALSACATEPPSTAELAQEAAVCADGPTTFGIDVSRFQGAIDWQLVANANVKFAYIQISRSLTDIDVKFPYNWKRAKEVGILRGAYQRFQPGQDVIGQAKLFLEKLGPFQPGDLPPLLDVEDANGLTGPQIAARVQQWIDYVEPRVGVKPIIYTGFYFWRDNVGGADFDQYPLWIANYSATCPLVPPTWTRWAFHQYSSTVTLPGITANTVDVNKFNGTLADLKALAAPPPDCDQMIDGTPGLGAENVVDDTSACFRAGGDPQFIREESAGYNATLKWTHATDSANPANYGLWQLRFKDAGRYRVEAYTPAPFNGSKQTVYQVHHGSELTPSPVDQTAVDGWNLVGEFDFAAGGNDQYVRVDDNTGEPNSTNTQIVFDALRFTRIEDTGEEPPPGEPDPDPPEAGGCSTSNTGWSWLVLVGLITLIRRRSARTSPHL